MSISVPGRPETGNPLTILNTHLGGIAASLATLADTAEAELPHVATVMSLSNQAAGLWGVFCFACSHRSREYTYPCLVMPVRENTHLWPPPTLMEVPSSPEHTPG